MGCSLAGPAWSVFVGLGFRVTIVYWGNIGIMEKKMETTIVYWAIFCMWSLLGALRHSSLAIIFHCRSVAATPKSH